MTTRTSAAMVACALALLVIVPTAWAAQEMQILELDPGDRELSDAQRQRVTELARRHVGPPPSKTSADLRLLQRLVDLEIADADDTFDLQALGVVLGDVMAAELPLHWVIVVDQYGRSRALRYRDTDNVFFPVTMISKRIERDAPIDVQALYERVRQAVAELESMPRRRRR